MTSSTMQRFTYQISIGGGGEEEHVDIMEGSVRPSQIRQRERAERLRSRDGGENIEQGEKVRTRESEQQKEEDRQERERESIRRRERNQNMEQEKEKLKNKQKEENEKVEQKPKATKQEVMKQQNEVVEKDKKKESKKEVINQQKNNEDEKNGSLSDSLSEDEIEEIMDKYDNLSKEQKNKYLNFFKNADIGNRGYLTIRRMVPAVRRLGFTGSNYDICNMFVDLDANMDHKVTLDEYMDQMSKKSPKTYSEEDFREIFDAFDMNKDGYITRDEFSKALEVFQIKRLEFELDKIFQYADKDCDGKVSFEDFMKSYRLSSVA